MTKIIKMSGITLQVRFMAKALHFYCDALGLRLFYGDENA